MSGAIFLLFYFRGIYEYFNGFYNYGPHDSIYGTMVAPPISNIQTLQNTLN